MSYWNFQYRRGQYWSRQLSRAREASRLCADPWQSRLVHTGDIQASA